MPAEGFMAPIKRAFVWHWNLLGLGVAVGFSVLSGTAGVTIPFVLAAELGYLGFLGLNPRFQNVLRGQASKGASLTAKGDGAQAVQQRFQQLIAFLTGPDRDRFHELRQRCAALLDLRRRLDAEEPHAGAENFRSESLDRLLWLFLKLLHQKAGLERFLASTKSEDIESELRSAEGQLATAKARDEAAGGVESRLTTSVRERIQTIQERLENHRQAAESLELAAAELDKTQQQITHICEIGMTMRDSGGLSAQIDSLSESLQSSEKAFAHTSLGGIFEEETAPPLLSQPEPVQRGAISE